MSHYIHKPTAELIARALELEAEREEAAGFQANAHDIRWAAKVVRETAGKISSGEIARLDVPPVTHWRDIRMGDIDLDRLPVRGKARLLFRDYVSSITGKRYTGEHSDLTLGELADRGERWWRVVLGIGSVGVAAIRDLIDAAARGEDVLKPLYPKDRYVPEPRK